MIAGPTAIGKTDISIELAADQFQIISVDSVQVYRYMDIGSGKPTPDQQKKIQHYCIDIVEPDCLFTAGDFCREAEKACKTIEKAGKIPLFVGGTGMYLDAFFNGLSNIPPVDPSIKDEIKNRYESEGLEKLYMELERVDPSWAAQVHPNDTQRIIRGLEVYSKTGKPISSFHGKRQGHLSDNTLFTGINCERSELRDRIFKRVDYMMKDGFLEEVIRLRDMGFGPGLKSMKSLGYAQLHDHLDGKCGLDEAVQAIKVETARFAKRQLTWFRRNDRIHWFNKNQVEKLHEMVYNWIG